MSNFLIRQQVQTDVVKTEIKVTRMDPNVQDKVQVFAEILNDINAAYVDPLDLDKITETGFNAMLQSLDPYTEFENPKATTQVGASPRTPSPPPFFISRPLS